MRPGQHNKRGRTRHRSGGSSGSNSSGSGGGNPLSRIYESNGPDVKVRGTAQTIAEKYLQLGRDAQSSSDIVMAESYYQYAEHYQRIVTAAQAYSQQMQPQYRRPDDYDGDEDGGETNDGPGSSTAEQPEPGNDMSEFERNERPPQQQQPYRQQRDFGRDQGGQQTQPQNPQQASRDRPRPRWQDERPRPPAEARESGQQPREQPVVPPRPDEQPRVMQPAANGSGSEDAGPWEAPSFLRRPAAVPQPELETAAPAAAPERKRYVRKPRVEKPEVAEAGADPSGGSEAPPRAD